MSLEDVWMITDYWTRHPPAAELLEVQMGWRAPEKLAPVTDDEVVRLDAEVTAALAEAG